MLVFQGEQRMIHCGESAWGQLAGPTRQVVTYRQKPSSTGLSGLNPPSTKPQIEIRPKIDG